MSYLEPSDTGFRFVSRERLRRFLKLKPPYNVCLELIPPESKAVSAASVHFTLTSKKVVGRLLDRLEQATVPSSEAADLLWELYNAVVCQKTKNCQKQVPRLYQTWCEDLWMQYLMMHGLEMNGGSTPANLTRRLWERALQENLVDASLASESESDSARGSNDSADDDSDAGPNNGSKDDDSDGGDANNDDESETVDSATARVASLSITLGTKARPAKKRKPTFVIYPQLSAVPPLTKLFHLLEQNVARRGRCKGDIYVFRQLGLAGHLKIDHVKTQVDADPAIDPVTSRLAEWKNSCHVKVIEVVRAEIECEAVERIEQLVHLTLHAYRRTQNPPCTPCYQHNGTGKHEWFEVDETTARTVVDFWRLFARTQPYDERGHLADFWSDRIKSQASRKTIPNDYPVLRWVGIMKPLVELLAQEDSVGRRLCTMRKTGNMIYERFATFTVLPGIIIVFFPW